MWPMFASQFPISGIRFTFLKLPSGSQKIEFERSINLPVLYLVLNRVKLYLSIKIVKGTGPKYPTESRPSLENLVACKN